MTKHLFTVDIALISRKNRKKLVRSLSHLSRETGLFDVSTHWFFRRITLKATSEDALLSVLGTMGGDPDLGFALGQPEVIYKYKTDARTRILLEPVMAFKVTAPKILNGPVKQEINERGGTVVNSRNHRDGVMIEARAPLQCLFGFTRALQMLSHGQANCTMEYLGYFPVQSDGNDDPTSFASAMAMRADR